MMVVLISVFVAFLYYVFTEYFKNNYIDCTISVIADFSFDMGLLFFAH